MQPSWEKHVWKSRLTGQVRVLDHGVLPIVWRCLKQGVPDWAESLQTISGVVVGRNGWKTSESNMWDGLMGLDLFETFLNLNNGDISVDLEGMEIVPLNSLWKAAHDTWGKTKVLTGARMRIASWLEVQPGTLAGASMECVLPFQTPVEQALAQRALESTFRWWFQGQR